jgi:F-type H+-transporting ATPase subunit a
MVLHIMNLLAVAAEEGAKHGGEGAGFILEEVSDHVIWHLPTIWGIDFSITKHVLMMWIAAAILIVMFGLAFRKVQLVPKGLANALESIVVFLREDILLPYLKPEDVKRFSPYILSVFFFILTCNLLGLFPMGATATSNISVTAALAILTFLIGQGARLMRMGPVGYFRQFIPPDIPGFVLPILFIAELMGLFTRHFALAIRLFANMIADHLVSGTMLGLIIIFHSYAIAPASVLMAVAVELLAVLIAFIQAYIFAMLSSVFIGLALEEEH